MKGFWKDRFCILGMDLQKEICNIHDPARKEGYMMKVSRESWILILLGSADLATTILWIEQGTAQEANPLFHFFWNLGLPAFIAAKYLFLLGPILVLEWARWRRPRFALMGLRAGVVAYVLVYGAGVAGINGAQAQTPMSPDAGCPIVLHATGHRFHLQQDRVAPEPFMVFRHAKSAVRHAAVTQDALYWAWR